MGRHRMSIFGRMMIPKLPRRIISRDRLLRRLHLAIGSGITVVEAPAGFGKTTLLAQFANDLDYTVLWLTLDAASGSPEVLAHQLGMALSRSADTAPPATASKFTDLQAYVNAELSAAHAASEKPLLVVVDNIHELVDQRESTLLVSLFLSAMPEGNELILAGRERPFLPELNAGIATGEIPLIDSSELAFAIDEVRAAMREAGTLGSPEDVLRGTAGWPVGVMAALASGPGAESLSSAAFDQYLEREVWEGVPEGVRTVLRRFSLQPSISRSSVEAEFGPGAWRGITAWLSARDFLCEHLSPVEFRLNPLLRQFIAEEFDREDPDGYSESFQRLIDELVSSGSIAEALEYTRAHGNEQQLVCLLEKYGARLLTQGSLTLLQRSFECVSEATLRRRLVLRGLNARVIAHTTDPEDALKKANGLLRDANAPAEARAHALLAKVRSLRLLGQLDEATSTALELAEIEASLEGSLRWEVNYNRAEYELSVTRDFLKAEALLGTVIEECDRHGIQPLGLLARSTLGQSLAMRGDAPAAVTVLTRAAQGWRNVGRSTNLGWVLNNLGMSHIQAGDFRSAATVLEEAVEEGLNCGNQRNVAYATGSLGDAELALGHYEKARVHYEEAIRICATDALDESLAALAIAGLSAALLGAGDIQQADFFSRRALLVAVSSANSYEIATCKLQQSAVEFASGNLASSIAEGSEAAERFAQMEVLPMLASAYYRVAMARFKAGKRAEAEESLANAAEALREPWMVGALIPMVRENPMFAQWAATRRVAGAAFRDVLERQSFEAVADASGDEASAVAPARFPLVEAHSLGRVSVSMGGREVSDEDWASARAKEMFFLLLSNRDGIRKEEAVEQLYPELPREKCNSAFHSNLYRVRKALYQQCVVKGNDGVYQLNPEAAFSWDVQEFEAAIARARTSPSGSRERAVSLQEALELYAGPFAATFQSEWAESIRARLDGDANESLATLAGYFAGREDYESAAMCMERVLRANQYNEEAAYQFARYRSRAGEVVQALRFIDEFGSTYSDEFGEQLPERFGELRAAIAAGVAV